MKFNTKFYISKDRCGCNQEPLPEGDKWRVKKVINIWLFGKNFELGKCKDCELPF